MTSEINFSDSTIGGILKTSVATKCATNPIIISNSSAKESLEYLQSLLCDECMHSALIDMLREWVPAQSDTMEEFEIIEFMQNMLRLTNALVDLEHKIRGAVFVEMQPISPKVHAIATGTITALIEAEKKRLSFEADGSLSPENIDKLEALTISENFIQGKGGAQ